MSEWYVWCAVTFVRLFVALDFCHKVYDRQTKYLRKKIQLYTRSNYIRLKFTFLQLSFLIVIVFVTETNYFKEEFNCTSEGVEKGGCNCTNEIKIRKYNTFYSSINDLINSKICQF